MLCQIIQFNASPPSPDQVGPLLFLPLKLLVPCFTPLSLPGWTFALPCSQVAGALLHPPLPTRLDLCSSFLSSCWCLASPPSPDQVGPLLFLPLKLLVPCFTPLSRPGLTFALPSSQVAGALLHPPLPTRRERAQLLIQLRLQPTFKG